MKWVNSTNITGITQPADFGEMYSGLGAGSTSPFSEHWLEYVECEPASPAPSCPRPRASHSASGCNLTPPAGRTGLRYEVPASEGLQKYSLIPEGTVGSWSYAAYYVPYPYVAHFNCPEFADASEHPHAHAC